MEYELKEGEQLVLSTGYLVSMAETCSIDIETVKGLKNIFLGGEGIFNTIITGPGKVVVQTMPLARLTNSIIPFISTPSSSSSLKSDNNTASTIGNILKKL